MTVACHHTKDVPARSDRDRVPKNGATVLVAPHLDALTVREHLAALVR
jgi:hypothetical protein